jgi:hypothetical protein
MILCGSAALFCAKREALNSRLGEWPDHRGTMRRCDFLVGQDDETNDDLKPAQENFL